MSYFDCEGYGQSCNVERIKTSSDWRNKALALNVEAGTPHHKIYHSMVIADLALAIAGVVEKVEAVKVDHAMIEAGALLHDVGISQTKDDLSPQHCMLGANIVRMAGYPEGVARCVEMHDLGGFTPEVVRELDLQPTIGKSDTLPETWEEKIVACADLVISYEGEYGLDMWNDLVAPAKVACRYLEIVYQRRLGVAFPHLHPQMSSINRFNRDMIRYCPRPMYEQFRPGINRMLDALRADGVPIPPAPMLSVWP